MNLFRFPLNILVVGVLIYVSKSIVDFPHQQIDRFSHPTIFQVCASWLFVAFLCCYRLMTLSSNAPPQVIDVSGEI